MGGIEKPASNQEICEQGVQAELQSLLCSGQELQAGLLPLLTEFANSVLG